LICRRFSGAASEINHSLGCRKNTVRTAVSTISEQGFACGRSDTARAPSGRRSSGRTLRPFRSAARHGVGPDRAYPTVCHSGFQLTARDGRGSCGDEPGTGCRARNPKASDRDAS
jgi:hypothetical protein